MNALQLFTKYAPNRTFIAVIAGALSGLFYAFLIPIVMTVLSDGPDNIQLKDEVVTFLGVKVSHSGYGALFLGLIVLILVLKSLSEVTLARVALDIRFRLRKDLYRQVLNTHVSAIEHVGQSRMIQSLSTDVTAIVQGAQQFPTLLTNLVTLFGMLAYLAYLDIDVFIYITEIIVFGIVTYQIPVVLGSRKFAVAREHQDILQEAFRGLVGGIKELKLSMAKQQVYQDEVLYKEEATVREAQKKGQTIFSLAGNYGSLLSFFAIGGVSFIFMNYHNISNNQLIGVVMVLLYVTGPISLLLATLPELAITRISLNKINQLYHELPDECCPANDVEIKPWRELRMENVVYRHLAKPNSDTKAFSVGPLNLTIRKGEITFIAGGNGSGKSTMSKVISQHYLPTEGTVYFGDTAITKDNTNAYRQELSCIYSDYYLFERILGADSFSDDYVDQINHYIEAFGLKNKVKVENGHFSTLKLSDGQRRRLALVVAIVEDKSLFVFDEWAADQDPQFKHVFYREILPYLRSKDKAVVVISHDDRYFDVADQLLVMESGQLKVDE